MSNIPGSAQILDPNGEPYGPLNPFPVSLVSTDQLVTVTVPAGTVVGDVLYFTGVADVCARALATGLATMPARAMVEVLLSSTSAQVRLGGKSQALAGLTPGASYFVSKTTPGKLVTSLGAFVPGDVAQLVGQAIDAVTLDLCFWPPVPL